MGVSRQAHYQGRCRHAQRVEHAKVVVQLVKERALWARRCLQCLARALTLKRPASQDGEGQLWANVTTGLYEQANGPTCAWLRVKNPR